MPTLQYVQLFSPRPDGDLAKSKILMGSAYTGTSLDQVGLSS